MTSPIKLISIDVDFTLVDDDKNITADNREAIRWAKFERGVHIAINSGRIAPSVKAYMDELGISDAYPSLGGCIVQAADGSIIEEHSIQSPIASEIRDLGLSMGCGMFLYNRDNWYLDPGQDYWMESETKASRVQGTIADTNQLLKHTGPNKMLGANLTPEVTDRLQRCILDRYSAYVDCIKSSPWYLEIIPRGVNKGTAVKALCRHYGIQMESVMAIGDYYNDVDMLKAAGLPVAMANAPSEIKALAGYVTKADNNHSGVAEAIRALID